MLNKQPSLRYTISIFQAILTFAYFSCQAGAAQGTIQPDNGQVNTSSYPDILAKHITRNLFPPNKPVGKPTILEVSIARDGSLVAWKQKKSCGSKLIDKCAELAITKSVPFPSYARDRSSSAIRRFLVTIDPFQSLNLQKTVIVVENTVVRIERNR
ncbi:MAG: cell envelope integrity protein TolA [Candidatus Obscuribacter sp.]|nr:cell envelope integrity protein TolA [Candidatus Obscuribacter sp.]